MSVLVIDIGTTGVRSTVMRPDAGLEQVQYRRLPPVSPSPGLVEFDAGEMARVSLELARDALAAHRGAVDAVGVTTQRASTIVWDRATGEPVGPGIGWQDLRTVVECITARSEHGLSVAPNQSVTKLAWLLRTFDAGRDRDLCFGTVDSWIAWNLTNGAVHVTDRSNAAVTGLSTPDASSWSEDVCSIFEVPQSMLPRLVDSSGFIAEATALPGAPPLTALIGDQQGSLVGQSCVRPGDTKVTFGTGGMLDMCTGPAAPASAQRSSRGTYPIVAWTVGGAAMWGLEAIMLSAGTNIDWLRDDLQIIPTADASHDVAMQCDTAEGVVYVPALLGLGTPHWDFGARGSMFGLTRGSTRTHVVRAVLEGIAHRGADLVDAAAAETGRAITTLRVDGGMTHNPTFLQALANASQCRIEVAPVADATTMGAGYLAGLASGVWASVDDIASAWDPRQVVEPTGALDRGQWAEAVSRSRGWLSELSALEF